METKQYSSTEEQVNTQRAGLASESAYNADVALLTKVKKIFPISSDKNIIAQTKDNNQQSAIYDAQSLRSLKIRRKQREMKKTVFGYELVLDLSGCDLEVMRSKKKLTEYVDRLCRLIKMKKYGKVHLPYFGLDKPQTKGYSLLQFIETSSITGHFSEYWRKSYINIFSCKPYDHKLALKFTKEFFKATKIKAHFLTR